MPWSRSIVPAEKWQVALIKSNGAQPSFSRARYAMSYRPLPWLRRFESCDMPLICVASIAMTQWPSNIINSYDMLWPSIFINWKKFYKCVFICVPKFLKRTHPNKHSWRFLWKKIWVSPTILIIPSQPFRIQTAHLLSAATCDVVLLWNWVMTITLW